ncbi:MAG: class A beta-lactamase [Acidobacteriota bacterium]
MLAFVLTLGVLATCGPPALSDQMARLAAPARGRVGAAALRLETGEISSWNGTARFPMQSVYKLPIGMAVLREVDSGRLDLEQRVLLGKRDMVPSGARSRIRDEHPGGTELPLREILRASVSDSDGTACDVLLRLVPAERVTAYLREIGEQDIVVATSEKAMSTGPRIQYRNWATPEAAVRVLRMLHQGRGVSPAGRRLLLDWMTETETGPRRIKGLLPQGTAVAHKTGTSGTADGLTRATNDIGIITLSDGGHLAVAVFVSDSPAPEDAREGVIAAIARAAFDCQGR